MRGEGVAAAVAQALVVDLLTRVVRQRRDVVRPGAEHEVGLGRREHHAVEEVDALAVPRAVRDHARDGRLQLLEGAEAHVTGLDVRRDLLQLDPQPDRVAEGAVGVREAAEQVGVRAVRGHGHQVAGAGEDVELAHRLVRQPAAERRRLDAEAGHRTAERDGAQLRDDERHEPLGQGGRDEVLVRAHALDVRRPGRGVDRDDAVEAGDVQPRAGRRGARAEQVRRLLGQPDGAAGRDRAVAGEQALDGALVGDPAAGQLHHGGDRRRRERGAVVQGTAGGGRHAAIMQRPRRRRAAPRTGGRTARCRAWARTRSTSAA